MTLETMSIPQINKHAKKLYKDIDASSIFTYATNLYKDSKHSSGTYLAIFLLGEIAATQIQALTFLKDEVSIHEDWRAQEVLAKAFDTYCKETGYEASLPVIKEWLSAFHPNIRRAVVEGLRVWTKKIYFRDHPEIALQLLSQLKDDESEYVRKSVGNAISDISKVHQNLVITELKTWDCSNPYIAFVYKKASRHLN